MTPSPGRLVHYTLSDYDAASINRRRLDARLSMDYHRANTNGVQVHVGNAATAEDVLPMLIVRVNDDGSVNGQVSLDGNDTLWVTSVYQGDGPQRWREPVRV